MTREEWFTQLFERLGKSKFRTSFHIENLIPMCKKCNKAKGSRIISKDELRLEGFFTYEKKHDKMML